jgi:hypothetical protein
MSETTSSAPSPDVSRHQRAREADAVVQAELASRRDIPARLPSCRAAVDAVIEAIAPLTGGLSAWGLGETITRVTDLLANALTELRACGFSCRLFDTVSLAPIAYQALIDPETVPDESERAGLQLDRLLKEHARVLLTTDPADRGRLAELVRDAVEEPALRKGVWFGVLCVLARALPEPIEIPPPPETPPPPGAEAPARRPCYERDHLWLQWEDEGLSPAKNRDRWNREYQQHGGATIGERRSGRDVVKEALKKARQERAEENR